MKLQREFFNSGAEIVARELLGKKLCRRLPSGEVVSGIITETEAYLGGEDLASHSRLGLRTKRNEVMYGKPGVVYVYFTYGMHWLLNFVCGDVGDAQAVLIRAIRPLGNCRPWRASPSAGAFGKTDGPAKLTKFLQIDGAMNGEDITKSKQLWVEDGITVLRSNIVRTPRIGVDYAGIWKDKPLRFIVYSNVLARPERSRRENLRIAETVYRVVKAIPKGKVMTYGAIAKKLRVESLGQSITPRLVGHILHINPDPENIPCHRVVNSKGKLAKNYAFGGRGEQEKRLVAEGVKFKNPMIVDLKECLWDSG